MKSKSDPDERLPKAGRPDRDKGDSISSKDTRM